MEKQVIVRQGIVFEIPKGYRSLEEYASATRLNAHNLDRLKARPSVREMYKLELQKLERAGL